MSYLKRFGTRRVPQTAPIPGSGQARNSAGGYAWAVDDWMRLRRFLILGTEGGSYYASEAKLTEASAAAVARCLAEDLESGALQAPEQPGREGIDALLAERKPDLVTVDGWRAIDAIELRTGEEQERPRVKLSSREELLAAARSGD